MTGAEIWFVVSWPLAGVLMGLATFMVIRLDRPKGKRKP